MTSLYIVELTFPSAVPEKGQVAFARSKLMSLAEAEAKKAEINADKSRFTARIVSAEKYVKKHTVKVEGAGDVTANGYKSRVE